MSKWGRRNEMIREAERPLEAEVEAIKAAHPLRSGRHDLYAKAMRLVGERHAKGDLVDLVVWLLLKAEPCSGQAPRKDGEKT